MKRQCRAVAIPRILQTESILKRILRRFQSLIGTLAIHVLALPCPTGLTTTRYTRLKSPAIQSDLAPTINDLSRP